MPEYVPLADVGYDVAEAVARIRGSIPEDSDLRAAGTNYQGFLRAKGDLKQHSAEIEKQLKFRIVEKSIAKDKVIPKAYNALKAYEKIGEETKGKLRVLRILCNDMAIGYLYPSLVLNNTQEDIPDFLSEMQKGIVEANYNGIEKDDPRLVKEAEKYAPIVKKVDSAFREYFMIYRDLWAQMHGPRRRVVLGDKHVPVLDEYESAYSELAQPGSARASEMPELDEINAYNGIDGAKWYMDKTFGGGSSYRFDCLYKEKEKTLLLPRAAEKVREIARVLNGLRQATQQPYREQNTKDL